MATDMGTEPIPCPPGLPLLQNLRDINPEAPMESLFKLAEEYGDIYKLHLIMGSSVIISNQALINECCDETRFSKAISNVIRQVRFGVHDGLFTAEKEEPNWGKAHRVLTPAFGPMPIRYMFDEMHDIATQLALKWARQGPEQAITVTDDFTRLTLDTLALCAMGYRFNSFYSNEMHPFVTSMVDFLIESSNRSRRLPLPAFWYRAADQKFTDDIAVLQSTAEGVLRARKEQNPPSERKDLLAAMLHGRDPRTGEALDDATIINNLITFLIAGHETTSGLLSFSFFYLMRHPETMKKARQEVDDVVGKGPVRPEHLSKLHYLAAVLREALRLGNTIPAYTVAPIRDEIIGGKYFLPAGQRVVFLVMRSHLDPKVWGDDAREFKPERMLDENFDRINREFPNCWKPFGNGARACIGRPFAWQESLIVLAIMLQNFSFTFDDDQYQLHVKESLTVKPKDFFMRAHLRDDLTPMELEQRLVGGTTPSSRKKANGHAHNASVATTNGTAAPKGTPLNIYYGSNSGTCESMADRLAADAPAHGFYADVVGPLDTAKDALPKDRPVVIVTASYEGEPPDNADTFVRWLEKQEKAHESQTAPDASDPFASVSYAVFGCGNHDWARTFHRIPKLVDRALESCGSSRLAPIGLTDAAEGNVFEDFEQWEDAELFPALKARFGTAGKQTNGVGAEDGAAAAAALDIEITSPRAAMLRQDVREARVIAVRPLTVDQGSEPKRHIEINLPANMTYRAGDYLAVLPFNSPASISRVMRRFRLPWDAHMTIRMPNGSAAAAPQTGLPTGRPMSTYAVLSACYELSQQATKRGILALAEAAKQPETKAELQRLAGDGFAADINAKRTSVVDLLERFQDIDLPFGVFLSLLPPMRVRQYSISSSPMWNPHRVSLTYSVLSAPALSGQGVHEGVASNFLARATPGDFVPVAVRPSHAAFHLPEDAENVPLILVAAGAGLAPFRGFIQERAALQGAGRTLAPALLFVGCRRPSDDLYREELDRWTAAGVVDVRRAYSRAPDAADAVAAQCRHVQDRLYHDREDVQALWQQGARMYVCGSRQLGAGVKETVLRLRRETQAAKGVEESEAETVAWFDSLRNERYAADVFD